jgi:hypothetical protein
MMTGALDGIATNCDTLVAAGLDSPSTPAGRDIGLHVLFERLKGLRCLDLCFSVDKGAPSPPTRAIHGGAKLGNPPPVAREEGKIGVLG